MVKLSAISPAHRDHQRYIVFGIISEKSFVLGDVVKTVWTSTLQLFGEVGTSEITLWMPSTLYNKTEKKGIIKTDNHSVEKIRAALACITNIENQKVIFKVLGITGTINAAKRKFLDPEDLQEKPLSEFSS